MSGKPIDECVERPSVGAAIRQHLNWRIAGVPRTPSIAELREWAATFDALTAAQQQGQAVAECHCATCTCAPGMTPAVRFDTTPADKEGAVRDHLIALGWTPPAQQPAAVDWSTVPDWRVMPFTGSWKACDERWEVYSPDGSGGVVLASDVRSRYVADLLDALATQHQEPKS